MRNRTNRGRSRRPVILSSETFRSERIPRSSRSILHRDSSTSLGTTVVISLLLVAITWFVFGQTIRFPFVDFDDPHYIYENPEIIRGLTIHGIVWAFTHVVGGNWHPLTTISHMLDCQLFGLNPGGHHFTNVVLHAIAVVLLFLVLRDMTGLLGRSAFVAAVFTVHPLRVESVAWIAERKDVLSAVLFMLTLGAYVRYTRKRTFARYVAMSILFACGLMSKPMLVTVPFVLLLLDYWPLKRISGRREMRRAILEKIPLFTLSAALSVATIIAQNAASMQRLPMSSRIANAIITYAIYVWQMVWPDRLAVFYPYGGPSIAWQVVVAVVFLIAMTTAAFWLRERRPYFAVGWFWYLSMLLPVIGIVQVGLQGHADRYTYLPQIGLYLIIAWGVAHLSAHWVARRGIIGLAAGLVIAALAWTARGQAAYWRDSEVLWTHAISVTRDNYFAHSSLADLLMRRGRLNDAITHCQQALRIRPDDANAENNLGLAYLQLGNERDAVAHFENSLRNSPSNLNVRCNLAWVLATSPDPALRDGERAVGLAGSVVRDSKRDNPIVLRTLAAAYAETGQFPEAVRAAERAWETATATGDSGLAADLEKNIETYRSRQPIRSKAVR